MILLRLSQIFLLTLPFQVALSPIPGIDLSGARIFALALFLFWLTTGLFRKKLFIPTSFEALLLVSFVFLSCVSFLWAENPWWAARRATFFLSFFPVFFVFSALVREFGKKAVSVLLQSFVLGAAAAALVGIIQSISQLFFGPGPVFRFWIGYVMPAFLGGSFADSVAEYPSLLANIGGATVLRATALFPDPHMFAFYMGLALPIAFGLALLARPTHEKIFFFSASFLILAADLLSFSRGGYVGLAFGAVLAGAMALRQVKGTRPLLFVAGISFAFLALLFIDNPIKERLFSSFSLADGSNQGRVALWKAAAEDISERPLLGYGIGNYPLTVKPTAEYREPIYAHNLFLDIASETGFLGGAFFFTVFFMVFWKFLKNRSILFSAPAVSFAIFFGHALFDLPLYSVHILPVLLLFLALPGSMNESEKTL